MSDVFGTEIAVEVAAGDISLRFATGQLAKQADGAVLVTSADDGFGIADVRAAFSELAHPE